MFLSTYQSLPESLLSCLIPFFFIHLSSPSDTPQPEMHWSKAVDRGVYPLISKHSQGAYGESAAEYSLHCVAELTLA